MSETGVKRVPDWAKTCPRLGKNMYETGQLSQQPAQWWLPGTPKVAGSNPHRGTFLWTVRAATGHARLGHRGDFGCWVGGVTANVSVQNANEILNTKLHYSTLHEVF